MSIRRVDDERRVRDNRDENRNEGEGKQRGAQAGVVQSRFLSEHAHEAQDERDRDGRHEHPAGHDPARPRCRERPHRPRIGARRENPDAQRQECERRWKRDARVPCDVVQRSGPIPVTGHGNEREKRDETREDLRASHRRPGVSFQGKKRE